MIKKGEPRLENEYKRAVMPQGNPLAWEFAEKYLCPRRDIWRGLGVIENSGLGIKEEYAAFDAEKRFDIEYTAPIRPTACRCGEVITGRLSPTECPLFGKRCTPEEPVGPCVVSSEGACAAAYKYGDLLL